MDKDISSKFPFKSKFIEVNGSKMHYVDEGKGDPILFLHGQPTSSYLWRNVIPHLQKKARCIAPDLIGMGKSDKPDIAYTFEDHYDYLENFIDRLNLKNITLVIHDWGSGLGFHYANKHRENIKGIAFMEAIVKPLTWDDFPKGFKMVFTMFRTRFIGYMMITVGNIFLKKLLPNFTLRKLNEEELAYYNEPYPTRASRKPVRMWPTQLPINGKPKGVHDIITAYAKWLTETNTPKLCIYAHPGAVLVDKGVEYIKDNFPNTKMVDIGEGMHYLQEESPHTIGKTINEWYSKL